MNAYEVTSFDTNEMFPKGLTVKVVYISMADDRETQQYFQDVKTAKAFLDLTDLLELFSNPVILEFRLGTWMTVI